MKNAARIILSTFVSCACCLMLIPCVPGATQTADAVEQSGLQEIAVQAAADNDPFAPEGGHALKSSSKPASFDLRHVDVDGADTSYVTPVKEQSPFGSCWGFGSIAAAETALLSSGLATDAKTLNLSEKQVVWFTANTIDEPGNPQNGEGMLFRDGFTALDKMNAGGATTLATNLYASGCGPTNESTATGSEYLYKYQGKNGEAVYDNATWTDKETGEEKTGFTRVRWSEDDDWTIPNEYRFVQDYRLKESYLTASPAECETQEDLDAAIDAIKEQLVNNRAVAISFCSTASQPNQSESGETKYLNTETWAQYNDDKYSAPNHVVTIVGYDDNYPKDNFSITPPADGAWLVKNSWGADTEDFPNNSYRHWGLREGQDVAGSTDNYAATSELSTGYFWLSYYDKSTQDPESYAFEEAVAGSIVDQHDCMPVAEYQNFATDAETKTANVFTAGQRQRLTDVSFFTTTPGMKVAYEVYLLKDGASGPEDGVVVAKSDWKEYPCGGYHRETLAAKDQVVLSKGQKYAIVVQECAPSGKYSISLGESPAYDHGGRWFESVINKGESFLYTDGAWRDLSGSDVSAALEGIPEDICYDNFPIKGHAVPVESGVYLDIKTTQWSNVTQLDMTPSTSKALMATLRGSGDVSEQPVISWESSDPSVFSVTPDTKTNGSRATVEALAPGQAYLTVDAGIYGRRVITINAKFKLSGADLSENDLKIPYAGKAIEPKPAKVRAETAVEDEYTSDLTEGADYVVSYENNVKCGRAECMVTGIGNYREVITSTAVATLSFIIVPAKAKITKMTPGNGTLDVSFASQKESGASGYVVSYKEKGATQAKTVKLGASATSAHLAGLAAGKTYEVNVQAYVTAQVADYEAETYGVEIGDDVFGDVDADFCGEASDTATVTIPGGGADKNSATSDGKASDVTSVAGITKKITATKKNGDVSGSKFAKLKLSSKKSTKNSVKLTWSKLSGAKGYVVYGAKVGSKFKKFAELSASKKTWTHKKLKKGTYYKYVVVAYKVKSNVKKVAATSKTAVMATTSGKVTNAKSVKLSKTKVKLKKGKSLKLKATLVQAKKKLKLKKYKAVAFESSNSKIASVSKKGKVKAKKKGTCYVYAYAQNGVCKRAKVTVK